MATGYGWGLQHAAVPRDSASGHFSTDELKDLTGIADGLPTLQQAVVFGSAHHQHLDEPFACYQRFEGLPHERAHALSGTPATRGLLGPRALR